MNKIQNRYRYELRDRLGVLDVSPMDEANYSISYEKEDEGKYFYVKQLSGKIIFSGSVFLRMRSIERSIYICTEQNIKIYRQCNAGEQLIFDGFFKLTEGAWDLDQCTVELKFEKNVPDKCLRDRKSEKVNLLAEISDRVIVKPTIAGGGVFEFKNCLVNISHVNNEQPAGGYYWCGSGGMNQAYEDKWEVYEFNEVLSATGTTDPETGEMEYDGTYMSRTAWVREIVELSCSDPAPTDWVIIENNCATTGKIKYAKSAVLYGCSSDVVYTDQWNYERNYNCAVMGAGSGSGSVGVEQIDNGFLMSDALELFVSKFCGGLTVVSDFFQINPENATDINYVTGERSQVDKLVLFQKSDVKRPNVSGNAFKAEWTFEKLTETLTTLFNVAYLIDGNVFRLEHISWFSRNSGLDLTAQNYAKWVAGLRKYTYNVDKIPEIEKFEFKEAFKDLWNTEINYTVCAIGTVKGNVKNNTVDELTTDVVLCLNNPAPDSGVVEDKGFVLVATRFYEGFYHIITEGTTTARINNTLSFPRLLRKYGLHNRPVNRGTIGGEMFEFLSVKPIKKGERITIPLGCEIEFNELDTIKTPLGVGVIDSAVFNFTEETIELDLLYDAFEDLTGNEAPTLNGQTLTTQRNVALEFAINPTDSDGIIRGINIKNPGNNGTVEILSNTEVRYTPDLDFEGWDWFSLEAVDDWGQVSAAANYTVTVKPENEAPTAVDNSYNVYHGETFSAVPNILANDSDDVGFNLVTTTVTTAQGVAITLGSDGSFSYVPPVGFEGQDSFDYTITDTVGLTSTATVFLNVGYKNKPVAVLDKFKTLINTVLVTDGTAGKENILANDYAPDGVTYTFTATAETKATTAGGSVQIFASGLFNYTPPTDFTGLDTFTYTANNSNGSGTGTVEISVMPVIYVKLFKQNVGHENVVGYCSESDPTEATIFGIRNKINVTLKYYSDAAGTVPFDVTGLDFRVNITEEITQNSSTYNSNWETMALSGVQTTIISGYYIYEDLADCNGTYGSITKDLSLNTGDYIII